MSCSSSQNIRFQLRRATESEWNSANPRLLAGEPAVSTDTKQIKIGNGDEWRNTDYINLAGGVGPIGTPTTLQSAIIISTATSKSGTYINLSSNITLRINQAVIFPGNITDTTGGSIVAGVPYYTFAAVDNALTMRVKQTLAGTSAY